MLSRISFIKGLGLGFLALNLNLTSFGQSVVDAGQSIVDVGISVNVNGVPQKYCKDYEVINNIVVFKEAPLGNVSIASVVERHTR